MRYSLSGFMDDGPCWNNELFLGICRTKVEKEFLYLLVCYELLSNKCGLLNIIIMNGFLKLVVWAACFWGQVYGLSAQTVWHNPAVDSLLPIQGRCWNREIGGRYQRLPQRAFREVRKPVWDLSLQTAGLYIKFYSSFASTQIM